MTLEKKIQERVSEIKATKEAQQKEALTADQQAQKDFEAANKKLVDLVKSIGVKGEITTPKYGESSIPYASFTVLDVPVALEWRDESVILLVNNAPIEGRTGFFFESDKEELSATLTEAVAQAVHDRGLAPETPTTVKGEA